MYAHRLVTLAALAVCLIAMSGVSLAQAPKKQVKLKYTPAQVADAEAKLKDAKCSLHYEEAKKPEKPNEVVPRAQVDIVAFPNGITDAEFARLLPLVKRLPNLQTLDLGSVTTLTSKSFKLIPQLFDLQCLFLDSTSITDADLSEFAQMELLYWLDLSGTTVGDAGLRTLAKYPSLQTLVLYRMSRMTTTGVGMLSDLQRLRVLHIDVSTDPDGMTRKIGGFEKLYELEIGPITDDHCRNLTGLRSLCILDVGNRYAYDAIKREVARSTYNQITDTGLKTLTKLENLRSLNLTGNGVTLVGVKEMANLKNLQELNLHWTSTTDAGLQQVAKVKTLRMLDVGRTTIGRAGLKELLSLPILEALSVEATQVDDEGLRDLTRVRTLRDLNLSYTKVSLQGVKEMDNLADLRKLSLNRTNITDATLPMLYYLKALEKLYLWDNCPNITKPGVDLLKEHLPKTAIHYDLNCNYTQGWPGAVGYPFRVPKPYYIPWTPTFTYQPWEYKVPPVANQNVAPPIVPPIPRVQLPTGSK